MPEMTKEEYFIIGRNPEQITALDKRGGPKCGKTMVGVLVGLALILAFAGTGMFVSTPTSLVQRGWVPSVFTKVLGARAGSALQEGYSFSHHLLEPEGGLRRRRS